MPLETWYWLRMLEIAWLLVSVSTIVSRVRSNCVRIGAETSAKKFCIAMHPCPPCILYLPNTIPFLFYSTIPSQLCLSNFCTSYYLLLLARSHDPLTFSYSTLSLHNSISQISACNVICCSSHILKISHSFLMLRYPFATHPPRFAAHWTFSPPTRSFVVISLPLAISCFLF